jgi:capsular exopolysaccharide synthesis family protein
MFINDNRKLKNDYNNSIITKDTAFSVVEEYKAIRTNLMFMSNGKKCPVIAFTSSVANEGKTTTCCNVAITFAQAGFKTLIIDGDMRKGHIHKFFDVRSDKGLSDVLAGLADENYVKETSYKNLYVITGGTIPPNPAELMTSNFMSLLLKELKSDFEYIFIDTPPVLLVTDAVALANKVDGTVVVVRHDYTRTSEVKETVTNLEQVGAPILGIVLNGYNERKSTYKKYYKRDYYKKGYYESYE